MKDWNDENVVDKCVQLILDEIDEELMDRYTWDWGFRKSCDRVLENPPPIPNKETVWEW